MLPNAVVMSQNPESDLVIVGGGVLGTFHAFHAAQRGLRVVLLERGHRPQGATVRNFGQVVPSGMSREWQRLGRESLAIYKSIQSEFDITVREQGSTYIASNPEEMQLLEELHAINRDEAYTSKLWTKADCLEELPKLNSDYAVGGLHFPEEVSVNPSLMIHRLQEFLRTSEQVDIRYGANVLSLKSDGTRVVARTSTQEEFSAAKAIVCSGNDFRTLYPELFSQSGITDVKLQMLRLAPQECMMNGNILTGLSIRRYESFAECSSYAEVKQREPAESDFKRWGIHILFKQEADGSLIIGDSHEYATVTEPELGYEIASEINECILREAQKIMNLSHWNVASQWSGRYCQTDEPRGIFLRTIDQHIHVATAIGGKGMTASAGFAKQHMKEIFND